MYTELKPTTESKENSKKYRKMIKAREERRKQILIERENLRKRIHDEKIEHERAQKEKYLMIKDSILNKIKENDEIFIISIEENYILIAKNKKLFVKTLMSISPFQGYSKSVEKSLCIASIIDYGRRTNCSDTYKGLMAMGCKTYRINNVYDVDSVLDKI